MKSINKITLLGNTTNDPELKYTSTGTAVCNFSIATNRQWKNSAGEQQDEATFHRVVAWAKLAEIISQYVKKGRRIYIEGRISNRSWEDQQGVKHYMTEVVADDMILLDNRRDDSIQDAPPEPEPVPQEEDVNIDDIDLGDLDLDTFDGKAPDLDD